MSSSRRPKFTIATLASITTVIGSAGLLTACGESDTASTAVSGDDLAPEVPLGAAIVGGDDQAVHAHILAGTPVNTKGPSGDTPLHVAAALGRLYAVEVLIAAGAELETTNGAGVTPLFNAAFFCHTEVLSALIEAGAATDTTDQNGSTIQQIMDSPWEQMRPVYEMVHRSIGLPFDEQRIEEARPQIAAMLR